MAHKNLKKFRHEISILKKKGLVSNVDGRSVKPTPRLLKLVKRFDDVLSGKATPVKLSRSETIAFKSAGYEVYKGKAIFPHSAGEKLTVTHGKAVVRQPNGVERVQLPIKFESLPKYLKSLEKNDNALSAMIKRDEYFGFRFHGHQSHMLFRTVGLMTEYFRAYKAVQDAVNSRSAKEMNDVYRNLEVVKVHRSRDWSEQAERIRAERGRYNPEAYAKKRDRRERDPFKQEDFLRNKRELERDRRARIKADPAKYKKYKKAAKKRAKKSRSEDAAKKKDSRT